MAIKDQRGKLELSRVKSANERNHCATSGRPQIFPPNANLNTNLCFPVKSFDWKVESWSQGVEIGMLVVLIFATVPAGNHFTPRRVATVGLLLGAKFTRGIPGNHSDWHQIRVDTKNTRG